MEAKINIAEILKDKPVDLKLYSPTFGCIRFNGVYKDKVYFYSEDTNAHSVNQYGKMYDGGECIIFPSKEMRDWSKFSWKRGDVLISDCGFVCIFKEWASDDYTRFNGCYSNSRDGYEDVSNAETAKFVKLDNNTAYGYVREIERKLGGILNLETLEIEKDQPEFKDGDFLFVKCNDSAFIEIFEYSKKNGDLCDHASLDITNQILDISGKYIIRKDEITELRLATEEEKKQFFSALANKGKAWDSEKKKVVNLKPKFDELKPFDKVLSRRCSEDYWVLNFYSHKTNYYHICIDGSSNLYCIPYNEETAHLLGTTDEWKGGEQ